MLQAKFKSITGPCFNMGFRFPTVYRCEQSFPNNAANKVCAFYFDMHNMQILLNFLLKQLYEFVYSTGKCSNSFTLFSVHPRRSILPTISPVAEHGMIVIEEHDDSPNIFQIITGTEEVKEEVSHQEIAKSCKLCI